MGIEKWTDEELIQVYDLQEKYAESVIDFVRHGEESDVYKFLQIIPDLNDGYLHHEQNIFRKNEFVNAYGKGDDLQGRYIYKDLFGHWKGADSLREIFEEKFQWDFAEARPEALAVFAGNIEVALETYSIEGYEKLRAEIPKKLMDEVKNLILSYPEEISDKACHNAIYGYTNEISSSALRSYRNEHMPEFERLSYIAGQESMNTIVAAYDLQAGMKIFNPELRGNYLTEVIRECTGDVEIFQLVYGEKSAELLRQADEKTISLARKYNFVDSEERLPVLENHKICLYGTTEQKANMYRNESLEVSDKDYQIILEAVAEKYEREGFSRKYQPSKGGNKEYDNQPYKVVTRIKSDIEQPQWLIMFGDGKIIKAKAN